MDSFSSAELMELVISQRSSLDVQLQFWITATFAVVAASFVAGSRLTRRYRVLIGALYLIFTSMVLTRWAHEGREIVAMMNELESRGVPFEPPLVSGLFRFVLMMVGTGVAVFFLYQDRNQT